MHARIVRRAYGGVAFATCEDVGVGFGVVDVSAGARWVDAVAEVRVGG